jgi:hypothetical protein
VLNLTAQNLVEFWAAITRPVDENGLGFTTEQARTGVNGNIGSPRTQWLMRCLALLDSRGRPPFG